MLDQTTVREIALQYAEEVKKVLNPEKIILFGSYVNGTPWEYSYIDIAVVMNGYQGNKLETVTMLYGLRRRVSIWNKSNEGLESIETIKLKVNGVVVKL